jgi:hypothetical protein
VERFKTNQTAIARKSLDIVFADVEAGMDLAG